MKKLIFLITFSPLIIYCQNLKLETISSGGSHHNSNNVVLDWTLGEMASESLSSENLKLTQGFNQGSFNISTTILDYNTNLNFLVYPNPVDQVLIIETETIKRRKLLLHDILGTKLVDIQLSKNKTSVDVSFLPTGIYFLSIYSNKDFEHVVGIKKIHH